MKTITLPVHSIVVNLTEIDTTSTRCGTKYDSGTIKTQLSDENDNPNCVLAMRTLETMILACAMAGVDIESPAFLEAIETTVDGIINNVG